MTEAYLNRIATATPPHDIHAKFVAFAPRLLPEAANGALFARAAARSGIARRFSIFAPAAGDDALDAGGFYRLGAFPDTAARMRLYKAEALPLAMRAVRAALAGEDPARVTHLLVTSCTGFYAPGLDTEIAAQASLPATVERTMIGFMGCYAGMNALKAARHIVRSAPEAVVLVVNLELCTLHLQAAEAVETLLSFLLFADGAAASLVSGKPEGLRLDGFHARLLPDSAGQITWDVGNTGFEMQLSGEVPRTVAKHLPAMRDALGLNGAPRLWAVHPGGRSVLDAVQQCLGLADDALALSRAVLREFGNMSSATILFVLQALLAAPESGPGCALAFGPGVGVEAMRFTKVG